MVVENTSFLFTGDAEKRAEHRMLDSGLDLENVIYHRGHHSSSTSSIEVFMSAIQRIVTNTHIQRLSNVYNQLERTYMEQLKT